MSSPPAERVRKPYTEASWAPTSSRPTLPLVPDHVERAGFPLVQRPVALARDGGVMHENVLSTGRRGDEAITLWKEIVSYSKDTLLAVRAHYNMTPIHLCILAVRAHYNMTPIHLFHEKSRSDFLTFSLLKNLTCPCCDMVFSRSSFVAED